MMNRFNKRSREHSRSGFTLLEITMSLGLFGTVIAFGVMVATAGRNAFVTTSSQTQLDARVKVALDRVAVEMERASSASLDPQMTGFVNDTDRISLEQVVDIAGGVAILGDVITIGFEDDPNDAFDGVDNDGDGLVDEGQLVMVRGAGGAAPMPVTLCTDVRRYLEGEEAGGGDDNGNGLTDESGFLIRRDGNLLTFELTIEGVRANGESTTRTSSTSILLRN